MKYFLFFLVSIFLISGKVYAEKTITIILTDEEYKAMTVLAVSPEEWVQDAAKNKARKIFDDIVEDNSDKQISKINEEEKRNLFKKVDLEVERKKRHGK